MIVPALLELKNRKDTPAAEKIRMVNVLVWYSLKTHKSDVFLEALAGMDIDVISSNDELSANVRKCCGVFNAKETDELCRRLRDKPKINSTP